MSKLRPLDEDDLELVLQWRNHPDVRKNMYTSHEISLDEHRGWWAKVKGDATKRYFMFEDEGEQLGVVNFVDISERNRSASWAFYSGDPGRRGLGSKMETLALAYAFEELALEKLSCEVLAFNAAVIRMHRKFGFRIEGVFRRHHHADTGFADVYRLALTKADWQTQPTPGGPSIGTMAAVTGATLENAAGLIRQQLRGHSVVAVSLAAKDGSTDGTVSLRVVSRIGDRAIVEADGALRGDVELIVAG